MDFYLNKVYTIKKKWCALHEMKFIPFYLQHIKAHVHFISRLEAEIEDARLKAKEEMMQGIQVAREMAQKELSDQKCQYENRIKVLEKELVR